MDITRSRGAGAALVVIALLLLAGCSSAPGEKSLGQASFGVSASKSTVTVTNVALSIDDLAPVAQPQTLSVPALGIDMLVEPHGLDDQGQMALPESVFAAAWYQYGSAPASGQGSTVIAAHVDSRIQGVGPFAALRTAQPGMEVALTDSAGVTHRYRITGVERINKGVVPWDEYFSSVGDSRLVLVTCGGDFIEEIRNYTDNYIVTAEKVS